MFPHIISAFAFVGGTGAVFIVIIFPMLIYVQQSKKKWYQGINLVITILNIIFSLSGFIAAFLSIYDALGYIDLGSS